MRPGKNVCLAYLRDAFCPQIKACPHHHPNLVVMAAGTQADPCSESAAVNTVQGGGQTHDGSAAHVKSVVGGDGAFTVVGEDWISRLPQRPGEVTCQEFMADGFCSCAPCHLPCIPCCCTSQFSLDAGSKTNWGICAPHMRSCRVACQRA
jgi:hypothetical protein